jgi:hypothetical protein
MSRGTKPINKAEWVGGERPLSSNSGKKGLKQFFLSHLAAAEYDRTAFRGMI